MPPKKSSGSDSGDKRREEERALEKMDLFEAIDSDDIEKVKDLLNRFPYSINFISSPPLLEAAYFGNVEIVNTLLAHEGIDVNLKDDDGQTALMVASRKGNLNIVNTLLEKKGIDVNLKDKDNINALMYATRNGHTEIANVLLAYLNRMN